MLLQPTKPGQRSLGLALAASLILHGAVLLLWHRPPESPLVSSNARTLSRLDASLVPRRAQAPAAASQPGPVPAPLPAAKPQPVPQRPPRKKILAMEKPSAPAVGQATPKWSVAEKAEMDRFLDELEHEAKARPAPAPAPAPAERSLAMAREFGRKQPRQGDDEVQIVERLPNSPPIEPFSLEMYFDALLKKLNRSAQFVRNDPRSKGVRTAQVVIRLDPTGALSSFQVVEAGDQQEEIAFVKAVVDRAVPFSPFPPDIQRSARSLAMVICIRPAHASDGFGFSRVPDGQGC